MTTEKFIGEMTKLTEELERLTDDCHELFERIQTAWQFIKRTTEKMQTEE